MELVVLSCSAQFAQFIAYQPVYLRVSRTKYSKTRLRPAKQIAKYANYADINMQNEQLLQFHLWLDLNMLAIK